MSPKLIFISCSPAVTLLGAGVGKYAALLLVTSCVSPLNPRTLVLDEKRLSAATLSPPYDALLYRCRRDVHSSMWVANHPSTRPAEGCVGREIWGYVVVQLRSRLPLFVSPGTAARHAPLSFTVSWSLLRFVSRESVMQLRYSGYLMLKRSLCVKVMES